jgi:hypothetical protein
MYGVMGSNPGQVKTCCFFHAAAMLLFYMIQKITVPKFYIFRKYYHALLYGPIPSGSDVSPALQVCSSAMLVLPIV